MMIIIIMLKKFFVCTEENNKFTLSATTTYLCVGLLSVSCLYVQTMYQWLETSWGAKDTIKNKTVITKTKSKKK